LAEPAAVRERLDRFLVFSRAVKTRGLAQKLVLGGAVRINGERTTSPDRRVGAGDVLTMAVHGRILVWRILATGTRRGPPAEAQALYEDLSPPPLPKPQA